MVHGYVHVVRVSNLWNNALSGTLTDHLARL